jgi:hypothetical protein
MLGNYRVSKQLGISRVLLSSMELLSEEHVAFIVGGSKNEINKREVGSKDNPIQFISEQSFFYSYSFFASL